MTANPMHGASASGPRAGLDFVSVRRSALPAGLTLDDVWASWPDRFRSKIERTGDCWLWTACMDSYGYGRVSRGNGAGTTTAYRFAYELVWGSVPDEDVDHLCRRRGCVRPDHLEAIPHAENIRRGRQANEGSGLCRRGLHEWTSANQQEDSGFRRCRPCRQEYERQRNIRRVEQRRADA